MQSVFKEVGTKYNKGEIKDRHGILSLNIKIPTKNGDVTLTEKEKVTVLVECYSLLEHLVNEEKYSPVSAFMTAAQCYLVNKETKDSYNLRKSYSEELLIRLFPNWKDETEDRKKYLLSLVGIDTMNYSYSVTYCMYREEGKPKVHFGKLYFGQERTDLEWVKARINGYTVASNDAYVRQSIGRWGYDFRLDLPQVAGVDKGE